jgi:hypothetical protein
LSEARNATRDEQARRTLQEEEERAIHEQARAGWAPAHDPRWLAQADLLHAARAWGAAAAYTDADPVAASAMHKSEERLRTLHPYAMNRYDRLRAEGASPADAMREAAPLFTREPQVRPGQPGTQLRLGAGTADPDADPVAGAMDGSLRSPAPDPDSNWRNVMNELADSPILWIPLIAGLLVLYILPSLIGAIRKVEGLGWVIVVNLIPTGVGWLAAMVLAIMLPRREPPMACPVGIRFR